MMKCMIILGLLVFVTSFNNRISKYRKHVSSSLSLSLSSKNSNIDIDNDTVKKLIDKVKSQDPEWLNSVFGDSLDFIIDESNDNKEKSIVDNNNIDGDVDNNNIDNTNNDTTNDVNNIGDDDYDELIELGYTNDDISLLKPSVIQIIIDKNVYRPKKEIPGVWLKSTNSNSNGVRYSYENSNRISNIDVSRRKQTNSYNDNGDNRNTRRISSSSSSSSSSSGNSGSSSNMNERFSWSGPPITDDELAQKRSLQRNTDSKVSAPLRSPRTVNEYRTTTNQYSDEPASFWPDTEEFKDMLLDESQWRLNMIGDWASPFVRSETKWRYQLYKRWLQLLDEGLGDGFDVVPEAFDNDDNYDAYEYGDDDVDEDNFSNREPLYKRQRQSSPVSSRSSQESLERRNQANAYDAWMKRRLSLDEDQWTDVSKEEMESRRLLDEDYDERNLNSNPSPSNRDEWFSERKSDVVNDEIFKQAWEDSKARKPISNAEENYRRRESNTMSNSNSKLPPRERRPRNRDFESDDI